MLRFTILVSAFVAVVPASVMGSEADAGVDGGIERDAGAYSLDGGVVDQSMNRVGSLRPIDKAPEERGTADPVLVEIRDNLRALLKGELDDSVQIDPLFSCPLDDPAAVSARLTELSKEKVLLVSTLADTEKKLADLPSEIPSVPRPDLGPAIKEPSAPAAPEAPIPPSFTRPKGKTSVGRGKLWKERFAAWQAHDEAQATYEEEVARHKKNLAAYNTNQARFHAERKKRASDLAMFEAEKIRREKKLATLGLEYSRKVVDARVRLEIAAYRSEYLQSLSNLLTNLPEPALNALIGIAEERKTIRRRAETVELLRLRVLELKGRLKSLENRARAGSLVGFRGANDKLVQDLVSLSDAFDRRVESLEGLEEQLLETAEELENSGDEIRRLILVNVNGANRAETYDDAFLKSLKEMRKHSKSSFYISASEGEFDRFYDEVASVLPTPEAVAQTSGAESSLLEAKAVLERVDSSVDNDTALVSRFRQAFRRERVTILGGLASEETRLQAYSMSRELLSDLIADFENLKVSVFTWAGGKSEQIKSLPSYVSSRDGVLRLVRMFLAVLALLVPGLLGRRLGRLVASGIRRFSATKMFRHRVGALVRWAGLADALLPGMVLAGSLYGAMALIGLDTPEVRFMEVAVRWLVIFSLGKSLLRGLTTRVSRGRPAFVSVSSETAALLGRTYDRLGFFTVLASVAFEWSSDWLGSGLLGQLIVWVMIAWVSLWSLWSFFAWRKTLSARLTRISKEGSFGHSFANRMREHRLAALLSPFVGLWIVFHALAGRIKLLLSEGGLFSYMRARSLRRRARTTKRESASIAPAHLPKRYLDEFPLYPITSEEDALLLPRTKTMEIALEQIGTWKTSKQDGSLVLLGEKGIGKTTFLTLLERKIIDLPVTRHSLSKKLRGEQALAGELGAVFGVPEATTTGAVARRLMDGPERVVLLDEAHNLFLRTIDGYEPYEALIRLVNFTSEKIFWVIVFNSFAWTFLNESRRRVHYFRRLLRLESWSREELHELISKRNKRSGLEVEFDETLLDEERSVTGDFEVIDGAEGFFRLLWEASQGNPRVATKLWLEALTPVSDTLIRVGLFTDASTAELAKLDRELLFTLAAICQHENLSAGELCEVTNVSTDFAGFAMRYLSEYGLVEPKHTDPKRQTLGPRFYPQVIRVLRQNHLLFEKE